jgi:hypothetical protein
MITTLKKAPLILLLTLALAGAFLVAGARSSDAHPRTSQLVGTWRMTSLELGTPGKLQPVPYSGEISFTKAGTVSVQAMNPDPDAADTPYTRNGYEAYYGTVDANRRAGMFVMTVESALVRDLIGQQLPRAYQVTRTTLILTPTDPAGGFRATYERI